MKRKIIIAAIVLMLTACISSDEVFRTTAPNGKTDAVLIETNGGATTSFGYEVYITPARESIRHGQKVADFYGATRSESAYGVNVDWISSDQLVLKFFKAHDARILKPEITAENQKIRIALKPDIKDQTAPAGGMLYNLRKTNSAK